MHCLLLEIIGVQRVIKKYETPVGDGNFFGAGVGSSGSSIKGYKPPLGDGNWIMCFLK